MCIPYFLLLTTEIFFLTSDYPTLKPDKISIQVDLAEWRFSTLGSEIYRARLNYSHWN